MIGKGQVCHAGFVCALPIVVLLMPQTAYATPSPAGPAKAIAAAAAGTRNVSYNGVRVSVPTAWPVVDLRSHPSACVRLDRSAVYLGSPGAQSNCPAHAVGRADTIWLKPAAAAQLDQLSTPSPQVTTVGTLAARVGVNPVSHDKQALFATAGVALDATWAANSSSIDRVLASAVTSTGSSTPAPSSSSATPTKPSGTATNAAPAATAQPAAATAQTPALVAESAFTGMAFDTCAAPSTSTMSSWISSPYRSAGIYIGGSMRACGDGNLSAAWVTSVHSMGWALLPIYVGPQAPCVNQAGLATISSSSAWTQGIANASDAVTHAQRFGMGAGTPIYYDMEAYNSSATGCSQTVMTFVSAWTSELHALGYKSGTYGSSASLMVDMSRALGTAGFAAPDDVWFAHWNQLQTTSEQAGYSGFPDGDWSLHQRVHQYSGSVTQSWGGAAVNIDANWVDGAVAGTAVPMNYGTNVTGPGGSGFVFTGAMSYWRSAAPSGLKGVAYWTHFSGATEGNGATWSPQLAPGRYNVQAYIPASSTASARYSIKDAAGSTVVVLSQASTGYRSLGTFTASSGGSISVHLCDVGSSSSNPQIWADAMAFRQVATAPGSPGSVHAIAGNRQAVVSWTAAADNSSSLTGYTVTASPGEATDHVSGTSTTGTVTGLTNGMSYTFTVTATSAAGTSPPSAASGSVTPMTVPGAPTGVSATPGNAAAVVSWTAPTSNGGSAITEYTATASPGGRTASSTGATTATVSGLANNTIYTFRVTASNQAGTSVGSSPSLAVTPRKVGFTGSAPTRVLDTRLGIGAAKAKLGAGAKLTLTIHGLPAGTTAVALNVTATNPSSAGNLTAYPGGGTLPGTSNLNYVAGQTIPNMVIVPLGPGNTVTFYNSAGTVNVIADVLGTFAPGSGAGFTGMTPTRVLDTRLGIGAAKAKLGAGAKLTLTIHGLPAGTTAVALNVTATNPSSAGNLTAYPGGGTLPGTSNLNYVAGQTIPNMVIVPLGPGNTVTFYNSAGTVNVIADVLGNYN